MKSYLEYTVIMVELLVCNWKGHNYIRQLHVKVKESSMWYGEQFLVHKRWVRAQ